MMKLFVIGTLSANRIHMSELDVIERIILYLSVRWNDAYAVQSTR